MLNSKIEKMLNEQINREFYSAYLYLYFADYYEESGLKGFANWYNVQAQEERDHALLMRQYLHNNDAKIKLEAIDKPNIELRDNLSVLKAGLEHERFITQEINKIYFEAYEHKDFKTMQFLDWFVKEQGEEELSVSDLIKKVELFGLDAKGLYLLDQEMASRTYVAPSLVL